MILRPAQITNHLKTPRHTRFPRQVPINWRHTHQTAIGALNNNQPFRTVPCPHLVPNFICKRRFRVNLPALTQLLRPRSRLCGCTKLKKVPSRLQPSQLRWNRIPSSDLPPSQHIVVMRQLFCSTLRIAAHVKSRYSPRCCTPFCLVPR